MIDTKYMDINVIRHLKSESAVRWTMHGSEKILERGIAREDVLHVIDHGEIIEEYPDDYPYPSCLIYGTGKDDQVIHVVAGVSEDTVHIITAYYPTMAKFEEDLKTRRQ